MKKYVYMLLLLIAASVIFSLPASAFQNEPNGFRGITWGTDINGLLLEMVLIEDGGNIKFYVRKNDKMQIGDANLEKIAYGFYKSRLSSVFVKYNSYQNFLKLKETLFQVYGSGNRPNRFMEEYYWYGGNADIIFKFNEISKKGEIWYSYKPIAEEMMRDRKEKAQKGASDL